MSLLIQALEKAEKGKAADSNGELSLEPKIASSEAESGQSKQKAQKDVSQQAAATVFTAKTEPKKSPTLNKALLAGIVIVLVLAVAGLQLYAYLNGLNKPEVVMPRPPVAKIANPPIVAQTEITAETVKTDAELAPSAPTTDIALADGEDKTKSAQLSTNLTSGLAQPATPEVSGQASVEVTPSDANAPNRLSPVNRTNLQYESIKVANTGQKLQARSQPLTFGEAVPMSRDTSVQVTRNQPANGVNPNLWAAYQAFNAGDDAAAQRNYRQVLQSDVRNVDALLGMAAIAARQGRNNDAAGWYGKVLEVEPRNDVAQAAMVNVLAQADPVSSESRIKNLIAQQPEAAHLYASLGNLYAEQNQWTSAQQAYFQAFHFDQKNAEYAFNLAVSLEQLGKSGLALPYYQRALALLPANGVSGIDRAQLESRIAKLQ